MTVLDMWDAELPERELVVDVGESSTSSLAFTLSVPHVKGQTTCKGMYAELGEGPVGIKNGGRTVVGVFI